jgi:hypothetical protein
MFYVVNENLLLVYIDHFELSANVRGTLVQLCNSKLAKFIA